MKGVIRLTALFFAGILLLSCSSVQVTTQESSNELQAISEKAADLEKKLQSSFDEQEKLRANLQISVLERDRLSALVKQQQSETTRLQQQLMAANERESALRARIGALEAEIDRLNRALNIQPGKTDAEYEKEIAALESRLAATDLELADTRLRLEEVEVTSQNMEDNLRNELDSQLQSQRRLQQQMDEVMEDSRIATEALDQSFADSTALRAEVLELESELAETTAEMGSQVEAQKLELDNRIRTLEQQIASTEGQFTGYNVQSEEASPVDVAVFYGTNRERIKINFSNILSPLMVPLFLLVLLFLIPLSVRTLLKEKFQAGAIRLLGGAIGLGFLYFSFTGVQASFLQWQAYQTLGIQYGPGRLSGTVNGLPYELGTTIVSIPPIHERGEVEKPQLIYFEFFADPSKHFVLSEVRPLIEGEFFDQLKARVSQASQNDMFVFVHGFHNTFQDAAFRTAQIAHDLEFAGAPVFFSWPSQGKVLDYPTDENNVEASIQDLKHFLANLKQNANAKRIHLIAHSMGNRALTEAIKEMGATANGEPQFNEVILAAPDMDAKAFRDIVPQMAIAAQRITLYASSRDRALGVSRDFHGGDYPRAGESEPHPVTKSPLESIDVSRVSGSHSYIADNGRVLTDLKDILKDSRELNRSIADPVILDQQETFWKLRSLR